MGMNRDQLYTIQEAATELDVTVGIIRVWRSRGRIVPVGLLADHDRGGRPSPLYRLEELRPLAERYHRHGSTRRDR